jgi:hypothetical protein
MKQTTIFHNTIGMNHYRTSDGQKVSQSTIDRKITQAKAMKIEIMKNEYGYVFCEECGINGGTYLDCSHDISVDKCKKYGMTELAWSVKNITIRCRKCHKLHDKN